jgi:hypothetical protein
VEGILCKPEEVTHETQAPPSRERQAEWEQILHLKPGELSPARVALRRNLLQQEESQAIKAALAADDSQVEV